MIGTVTESLREIPADLEQGLANRPCNMSTVQHREIVKRVMKMYQACKRDQPQAAAPYQPGGEWANYLAERMSFYDALQAGDLGRSEHDLSNFWRNPLGMIVKEYANFHQLQQGDPERVERFQRSLLRNLRVWQDIFGAEISALRVPCVGNPWGLMINDELVVPKACRFHALASQIAELTSDLGRPVVAEIGAGYGGQAYYLLRDHAEITYIDFDLPESLVLAAYYLICCLPDRKVILYGESNKPLSELIREYDLLLLPNFALAQLDQPVIDVALNTFSFSEMPMETLATYLRQLELSAKHYLLHNNMDRKGVFNRGFERIPASQYPLSPESWKLLYKRYDLFHGHEGDYREFLLQRISGRQAS
jgi:hypothetical protein